MSISLLTAFVLSAPAALAASPDLTTAITAPAVVVDADGTYSVRVRNVGSANAGTVTLTIQLPATGTSPGVYPMGDVGAMTTGCSLSGTKITCTTSSIRKGKYSDFTFVMAVPEKTGTLDFSATASTSGESNTGNNGSTATGNVSYYSNTIVAGTTASNEHCTGTSSLTSFFECELFPSSISMHDATFEAGGIISIPGYPDYSGTWSNPGGDTSKLEFTYTELGSTVATFSGRGTAGGCYDGLTTFPGSTWVAPYRTCF